MNIMSFPRFFSFFINFISADAEKLRQHIKYAATRVELISGYQTRNLADCPERFDWVASKQRAVTSSRAWSMIVAIVVELTQT